jgi:hypothetical protein
MPAVPRSRVLAGCIAAIALMAAAMAPAAMASTARAAAPAQPLAGAGMIGTAWNTTVVNQAGLCLDVAAESLYVPNGGKVQSWTCRADQSVGGLANQSWDFYRDGTIRSAATGQCLTVNTWTRAVVMWACRPDHPSWEPWRVNPDGTVASSGLCLDSGYSNGVAAFMTGCGGPGLM